MIRAEDEKSRNVQNAQLGGTAWLGLGGSVQPTGDAGGGGEISMLNEYLESLDGPGSVGTRADMRYPLKADVPLTVNNMAQRSASNGILDTPPSMLNPDTVDTNPLAPDTNSLSILSPQVRNAGTTQNRRHSDSDGVLSEPDMSSGPLAERHKSMASSTPNISSFDTNDLGLKAPQAPPYPPSLSGTASKTEQFLLTAADQTDGSRDERLKKVIQAKWEAGLLKPYNHVNGYARLNKWMEESVSPSSRRRILKPLSAFHPIFTNVAKNLTNFDLIYIEEAFERLLLDYDRVFSIQGTPACLWRRTGEIYKGNKEFAELVGMPIESLREGRLCIYELMAEESAVNYWEKYGSVSFDPSQKAVLTMCKLRTKNRALANAMTAETASKQAENGNTEDKTPEDTCSLPFIPCCFSFTIRRDKWNIPTMIVGNFLPSHPAAHA